MIIILQTLAIVNSVNFANTQPIYAESLSSRLSSKSHFMFQSQFSRNLSRNLQEAKSDGCFI
ncbi:MAG: hypothetical protein ACK58Z_10225, partial [Pseudanabaena sp.]